MSHRTDDMGIIIDSLDTISNQLDDILGAILDNPRRDSFRPCEHIVNVKEHVKCGLEATQGIWCDSHAPEDSP